MPINPCLTCGACCAHYRVSFYWGEADPAHAGVVPAEMTERVDGFRVCMAGTNQSHPRCVALAGMVGGLVRCTIYDRRPSPCHEFGVQWVDGRVIYPDDDSLERCQQARLAWGLPPLWSGPTRTYPTILPAAS